MNAALLSLTLLCAAAPPLKTAATPETLLYVRTTPSGAEVLLDGKPLGASDGLFPVKAGAYRIVVDLEGHEPEEQQITIRDGRITRIELKLKKHVPPSPASRAGQPAVKPPSRVPARVTFQRRRVAKRVSDFPDAVDLSTPESAWAAYHRASARMDAKAVVDLSWVTIDPAEVERFWDKAAPDDLAVYNQAQLDAELVELLTYRGKLVEAISCLAFPPGKGRHPYSSRCFGLINGQWKNLGEDRCPTLEAAIAMFNAKKDNLWEHFRGIEKDVTTTPSPEAPSADPKSQKITSRPGRQRHFVRLVVGKESMTFEGQKTSWQELPTLLEKIPSREHTVLEIARASDDLTVSQWNDAVGRAVGLAGRLGFEYLSDIGNHPLGSMGSPTQTVPDGEPRSFGPVIEQCLQTPQKGIAELLDLDTGRRATMEDFGHDDRQTHRWIREHGMDVLGAREAGGAGILLFDVAVFENPGIQWEAITAAEVVDHRPLEQTEPHTITPLAARDASELPKSCLFRTREGGLGALQLVGPDEGPRGVKIRYKMVKAASTGKEVKTVFTPPEPSKMAPPSQVAPAAEVRLPDMESVPGAKPADFRGRQWILDLASGEMLAIPDHLLKEDQRPKASEFSAFFTRQGKGDLFYVGGSLFCLRGAKAMQRDGNRLLPMKEGDLAPSGQESSKDLTRYEFLEPGCRVRITTAERKHFDVWVTAVIRGDLVGEIWLRYKEAGPSLVPGWESGKNERTLPPGAREDAETDPVLQELRKIVLIRQTELERVRKLAETKAASVSELNAAELALAEARLRLAERSGKDHPAPAKGDPLAAPEESPSEEPVRLKFDFRHQPWGDVLEWLGEKGGLSLVLDEPPSGVFNYRDDRSYTLAEAIDLLNSVLLASRYTLVRRDRMLMLINLKDGIPANLIPTIPPDALDQRGEFELVSVLFDVGQLSAEAVAEEIRPLLGPHGAVAAILPGSRQILATDTAGRLRTIREVIQALPEKADVVPEL